MEIERLAGKLKANTGSNQPLTAHDLYPTLVNAAGATSSGLIGLYQLADDPGETLDLSAREPAQVKLMQAKLDVFKQQLPATAARRPNRRPAR